MVKNPPVNASNRKRGGFNPWVRKIPWRRACQPTPVFLPEESHGQRSLAGYSPSGRTESDTTEATQHAHQWLGFHDFTAEDVGSILWLGN